MPDSEAFEEWRAFQRETYHRQLIWALSHLAIYYERQGDIEAAVRTLRRQVSLEPWREEALHQLMQLLARHGERRVALQQYEHHSRYLADTLGSVPDDKLTDLYRRIEAGETICLPIDSANPYQGLDPFTNNDAAYFFGREASVTRLQEILMKVGLVGVFGPSGSGKSSLVQAGLLPRLTAPEVSTRWLTAVCRPGGLPLDNLVEALLGLRSGRNSSTEAANDLRAALESGTITFPQIADQIIADSASGDERPCRLLLVVDSFEELYTLTSDADDQHRFIDLLLTAAVSPPTPCYVLLSLRADFMSQILAYRPLADAMQLGGLALGPMTRDEMTRAIVEPARLQGVSFQPGLVARLLTNLGDGPGQLPLLSFAMNQLWQKQENGRLTHAAYEALGQVGGAISQYANQAYDQLDDRQQQLAPAHFRPTRSPRLGNGRYTPPRDPHYPG